ncbi:DUF397 domain-containing protein [Streptomyces sp. NPDC059819]|uniref:DUF397 domain-containing protein n=1 Tax=Streptomyces sp. NPDC059819 TaxID=3346963 RepID=UPI003663086C
MVQPRIGQERPAKTKYAWKKSSYSNHEGECVEVAAGDALVAFRDSKESQGPVISVDRETARVFLASLVQGRP